MDTIVLRNFTDFSQLFQQIRRSEFIADIDISNYKFLHPREILMLTQYFVLQNFNEIDGSLIVNDEIGWYVDAINLMDFCNTNYQIPTHQKQSILTAIPIRRIDVSTMNEYITHALGFFSKFCFGKDTFILSICISEIINNVNDHSKSIHDAYIFSQYYPKQNKIKFAISDLGVGIPATVNQYLASKEEPILSNLNALEWATQKGKSAKSQKYNLGLGLYNIISFLKGTGSFEIYSDNVLCSLDWNGKLRFRTNPIQNFIGTLITIDININNLEPIDETILEDFTF